MNNLHEVDWSQIPTPEDDAGANHLPGRKIASVHLPNTNDEKIDLSRLKGRSVVYAYPMTGRPDVALPDGWNMIPGARGCTPQSCAFRDHANELHQLGVQHIFGVSTQSPLDQKEAAARLHLPFPLLSDAELEFAKAMQLPTFQVEQKTLLKRLTMVIDEGVVTHTFYPVFPPDQNAQDVVNWLTNNAK
ncbi:MAG: peroxiredoxin [Hyphomicrobiaceae bacterium]